jgi:hypothetical protein
MILKIVLHIIIIYYIIVVIETKKDVDINEMLNDKIE